MSKRTCTSRTALLSISRFAISAYRLRAVIVFNEWKQGYVMQDAGKIFKAFFLVFHFGLVIAVSSWALAQEGGMSAPDVIELSDMAPNRSVTTSMSEDTGLMKKPVPTTHTLNWETGTGKSYLIPALEIPAFLLLLNGFDRLVYHNDVEGGKKVYESNLATFGNHVVPGPWGVDQDSFAMNQFMHPYRDPYTMDSHDQPASITGSRFSIPMWAAFSGKQAGRPHTHPTMTKSPAALPGPSSGRHSFGWPVWCSRAMAANPGSGTSWERRYSRHPRVSIALPMETGSNPCFQAIIRLPFGACSSAQV